MTAATALLPPACLAVLALLLLLGRRRVAALLAVALLVLLSMAAAPHALMAPLLSYVAPAPTKPPGAIVVIAGGNLGLLNPSGALPGMDTLTRLRAAAALARRTSLPILVDGAASAESLESDFGLRSRWIAPRADNVWQSADAAVAALRPAGIGVVYLVVQPWDVRLAASVFRAAGLEVVPAPVSHAPMQPLDADAVLPLAPVWLESAVALRQWAGLACQAMPPCVAAMRGGAAVTPGPN